MDEKQAPELSEAEKIRVAAFGLDKPERGADSGYTPSMEEIREYVIVGDPKPWEAPSGEVDARELRRAEAFDRWLAAHDAVIRVDQIEKDAALANELHQKPQDAPALISWRIRQQLSAEYRAKPYTRPQLAGTDEGNR